MEAKRERIVAGLRRAMARGGYSGASVQAIAKEAGLTPGLVHYYFTSKREILRALIAAIHERVLERTTPRASASRRSARARLLGLIEGTLEARGGGEDPELAACWVHIGAEALRDPAVRADYGEALEGLAGGLRAALREALREEGRSTRNVRAIAYAILAAVQGVHQLDATAPGLGTPGCGAPMLRHMVEGLLEAQPRRRAGARA